MSRLHITLCRAFYVFKSNRFIGKKVVESVILEARDLTA